MTERTRSKKSNIFAWGVMGFLVLAMGGFGLSSAFLSSGGSAVASVGDQDISVDLFYQAYRQDVAQASQRFGTQLTLQQAQSFGVDQITLQRLLTIAAIDNESNNLNVSVGDEAVRQELQANPAFRGLTGSFDTVAYDFALQQIGMTRDEYDVVVRNGLTQAIIRDGVSDLGASHETATNTVMAYIGELRNFEWVLIGTDDLPNQAEQPNETALRIYYEANPDKFTQSQTRDITYISLTPEMLAEGIVVSEQEIEQEFEARAALYNTPASIIIDRIAFGNMEDAQEAADKINAGESSFDIVAVNRGLNPADIALGSVTENQVSPDARAVLFTATEPGIYGPVSSKVGPALFRINAVRAAKSIPLADVHDEIRDAIALNTAGNMIVSAYDNIDDLIAGGASLEDVAAETDMQIFTINFSVDNVEGLTAEGVFIAEALVSEIAEERDVLESANGGIFALRVDAINAEFIKPLSETRDIAIAGRIAERNQELVLEHAATLQSLIESGADFGATMAANGLTANTVIAVSRNAPSVDIPPTVSQAVFEQENGALTIVDDLDGAYVLHVTDVSPYDPENEGTIAVLAQIEGQISQSLAADIFTFFSNAVISEAGFTVNQPLISSIILQGSGGYGNDNDPGHGQPGHVHR